MTRLILLVCLTALPRLTFSRALTDRFNGDLELRLRTYFHDQKYTHLQDSLPLPLSKMDSIRQQFNATADSIKNQYEKTIGDIDSQSNRVNQKIDSLQRLNLPTNKYEKSLKKLSALRQKTEGQFDEKLVALKLKTTDKLNAVHLPAEKLTKQIEKLNIESGLDKVTEPKIPIHDLPNIDGNGQIPPLNAIQKSSDLSNISKIDTRTDDIANITQQAHGYQEDIKGITEGNLQGVQNLPETIESQTKRIGGMEELQKQRGIIDEQETKIHVIKDADQAKEKAVEMARDAAVDHFEGKQEQLKIAMEKISKYKQKYSSVSSIKDLPKRPPNPMKGKSVIERLIPGLQLQYQQKNFYLLDVNPYVGYKISGRLVAGAGWNYRYAYDHDNRSFTSRARVFGPRAYVDFKLGKGFIAHVEGETMNSFVPSVINGNPDTGQREWVWSCMTGLKKEYRIYKNLKGVALIQYNLFNRFYKAPYVDRLNSRIGFEYNIKKARRAENKQ